MGVSMGGIAFLLWSDQSCAGEKRFRRRALVTTATELKAMAMAPKMGLSAGPPNA